ncbi:MAG: PEP-CTERM sorting domain-containing protein, partial [Burkholderiales bacterium]
NDAVAISIYRPDVRLGFTLGLTATPSYASSIVTPDSPGNFSAQAGVFPGQSALALWNFNYYVGWSSLAGASGSFSARLLVDSDPSDAFNPVPAGGGIPIPLATDGALDPVGGLEQDSWNMGFSALLPFNQFSPGAAGVYTFELDLLQSAQVVARTLINVHVVASSVPEPSSLALLAAAMLPFALRRRRK